MFGSILSEYQAKIASTKSRSKVCENCFFILIRISYNFNFLNSDCKNNSSIVVVLRLWAWECKPCPNNRPCRLKRVDLKRKWVRRRWVLITEAWEVWEVLIMREWSQEISRQRRNHHQLCYRLWNRFENGRNYSELTNYFRNFPFRFRLKPLDNNRMVIMENWDRELFLECTRLRWEWTWIQMSRSLTLRPVELTLVGQIPMPTWLMSGAMVHDLEIQILWGRPIPIKCYQIIRCRAIR